MTKDVVTQDQNEQKALATDEPFEFDGPTGFEGVDRDCVTIPFLKIAQSATDEAKRGSPKYIPGLEPGMFFCPATRRVYGNDVNLIIIKFYRHYITYDGEGTDAKFTGIISPEDFKKIEKQATRVKSYHMLDGTRYVDTRNFIVMVAGALQDGPMLLSMTSTGIAPSRKWITQAQNFRAENGKPAPIWANVWNLATGYQDNPAGSYYQVARVERVGYVTAQARPTVVAAFLDAGSVSSDSILGSEAHDEKMAPEASHESSPSSQEEMVKAAFGANGKAAVDASPDLPPNIF